MQAMHFEALLLLGASNGIFFYLDQLFGSVNNFKVTSDFQVLEAK